MNEDAQSKEPVTLTPARLALWALPVLVSLGVLAATFALNWEPWFGYASVIAGVLLSFMIAAHQLGIGGDS